MFQLKKVLITLTLGCFSLSQVNAASFKEKTAKSEVSANNETSAPSTVAIATKTEEAPAPAPASASQAKHHSFFAKFLPHNYRSGGKSRLVAGLLAFFLGGLGIHRFYLGYTWQGVVQLFTAGGLGIWALIDFIRICTGDLKPKNGEYSK